MSEAIFGALIGAIAALAGTTLTFFLEAHRRGQDRERERSEALRSQRAAAYRSFTSAVLVTANELAKASVDVPGSIEDRRTAAALVNRNVTGAVLELELIAEPVTYALARDVRDVLVEYRTLALAGASSQGDDWKALGARYLRARDAFQRRARAEILGVEAALPQALSDSRERDPVEPEHVGRRTQD